MRRIRSKDTKPELLLRSALHKMGFRFRLHVKDLPGRPDIVFPSMKKIILVHGCFWHMHPDPHCVDARLPNSRREFWIPKLNRTKQRDEENMNQLMKMGWKVLVIWECELKQLDKRIDRITQFLGQ